MQRWPRINVHVVTANPDLLADRELRGRTIELAIGAMPAIGTGSEFELTPLFDDNHVVVASAVYKWARRRKLELGELADIPWVLPPSHSPAGRLVLEAFHCACMPLPASRVLILSIPLALHLVATGPIRVDDTGCDDSPVAICTSILARCVSDYAPADLIMTHKGRTLSPLAARFVAVAKSVARASPA